MHAHHSILCKLLFLSLLFYWWFDSFDCVLVVCMESILQRMFLHNHSYCQSKNSITIFNIQTLPHCYLMLIVNMWKSNVEYSGEKTLPSTGYGSVIFTEIDCKNVKRTKHNYWSTVNFITMQIIRTNAQSCANAFSSFVEIIWFELMAFVHWNLTVNHDYLLILTSPNEEIALIGFQREIVRLLEKNRHEAIHCIEFEWNGVLHVFKYRWKPDFNRAESKKTFKCEINAKCDIEIAQFRCYFEQCGSKSNHFFY